MTGLSRTTIWRMVKTGRFPKPVELGPRAPGWRQSDVHGWLESRPEIDESPPDDSPPDEKASG